MQATRFTALPAIVRYTFIAERVEKEGVWRERLYFITAGTAVSVELS
jgi:hypothetical protein